MPSSPSPGLATLSERALRHAPVGVAVLQGEALRVDYLNPALLSMTGLSAGALGQPFEQAFPPLWSQHLPLLHEVLRSGEATTLKELAKPAGRADSGPPAYLNIDCIPIDSDGGGRVDAVMLCVVDVTEQVQLRRLAEAHAREAEAGREALAEREAQLRLSASSAPLVLYARDRELNMSWIYKPRSSEDLAGNLGKTLEEVVDPADVAELRTLYLEVLNSGEPRRHLMKFHHSPLLDSPWQDIHVQPQRDRAGHVVGVLCAAYDVSELVKARTALAEREALLELALEVAAIGTWDYHADSGRVSHSASLAKIFGLPAGDAEGPALDLRELIHPDDLPRVQAEFEQALSARDYVNIEYRIRRRDRAERWVTVRARTMGERGERLVGVILDITDERQLRERLERSNHLLERFSYTVAHDLKSPLQAILGFGQLLARSGGERLTEREREHLDLIAKSGRQMSKLIDDLLTFAHAAHTPPVREAVALEDALAQALDGLRLDLETTASEIIHTPLPIVLGNPTLLVQALRNLIGNAFKYRDREQPLRVHISATRQFDQWVITMQDNGIGIAPEQQGRVFDVFSRAHPDSGYDGIGLGLTLVRDAIEHHGGRIWLESTPGQGSTFYFSLPADPKL